MGWLAKYEWYRDLRGGHWYRIELHEGEAHKKTIWVRMTNPNIDNAQITYSEHYYTGHWDIKKK